MQGVNVKNEIGNPQEGYPSPPRRTSCLNLTQHAGGALSTIPFFPVAQAEYDGLADILRARTASRSCT